LRSCARHQSQCTKELHENIDNPAVAIAVINMAADLPILSKLFPALIVHAHQTLIEEERRLARQRTRWDKIRAMFGWIFRPRAKASAVRPRLVQQPRNRSVFPKDPF
jgi:hypothetical protein